MQAVIFDLDGTLVHSAPDLHAAAAAMLADLGRPTVTIDQVTRFIGNGVPRLVERCLLATGGVPADGGARALAIFARRYDADPVRLTRPYPGVAAMLDALQAAGIAMAVCTNKPERPARLVLARLGLGAAGRVVVGGDTLPVTKPDPATVRRCLDEMGAKAADTLYVGDSETDAAAAKNAGLRFGLFAGGYRKSPAQALGAAFVFTDFDEVVRRVLA